MIILGIDPGTTKIGYGVIEKNSQKMSCLDYGVIAHHTTDRILQIKLVGEDISKLIKKHQPTRVAIEKLFFFKNQKTIIPVSEMRGAILAYLAKYNVELHEFTPLEVKQAVSGYGRADKRQVEQMVGLILGLKQRVEPDDAADGLAIAICCANTIIGDDKRE